MSVDPKHIVVVVTVTTMHVEVHATGMASFIRLAHVVLTILLAMRLILIVLLVERRIPVLMVGVKGSLLV